MVLILSVPPTDGCQTELTPLHNTQGTCSTGWGSMTKKLLLSLGLTHWADVTRIDLVSMDRGLSRRLLSPTASTWSCSPKNGWIEVGRVQNNLLIRKQAS